MSCILMGEIFKQRGLLGRGSGMCRGRDETGRMGPFSVLLTKAGHDDRIRGFLVILFPPMLVRLSWASRSPASAMGPPPSRSPLRLAFQVR